MKLKLMLAAASVAVIASQGFAMDPKDLTNFPMLNRSNSVNQLIADKKEKELNERLVEDVFKKKFHQAGDFEMTLGDLHNFYSVETSDGFGKYRFQVATPLQEIGELIKNDLDIKKIKIEDVKDEKVTVAGGVIGDAQLDKNKIEQAVEVLLSALKPKFSGTPDEEKTAQEMKTNPFGGMTNPEFFNYDPQSKTLKRSPSTEKLDQYITDAPSKKWSTKTEQEILDSGDINAYGRAMQELRDRNADIYNRYVAAIQEVEKLEKSGVDQKTKDDAEQFKLMMPQYSQYENEIKKIKKTVGASVYKDLLKGDTSKLSKSTSPQQQQGVGGGQGGNQQGGVFQPPQQQNPNIVQQQQQTQNPNQKKSYE